MEWSRYNFIFEINDKKNGIYNSYTNSYISVTKEVYKEIKKFIESNDISSLEKNIKDDLIKNKNIVNSDMDILNILKFKSFQNRFKSSHLRLVIAPTVDCNFSCFYCFEGYKKPVYMTADTENNIIKFIKSFNKNVSILWFGGEPLLNFKSIKSISKKLKTEKIQFNSSIITNGYLLTEEKVDNLNELKINTVQVTLDGIGEQHNKRRPHKKGYNTFDKIVANLDYLVPYAEKNKIYVTVKVTIDKDNKDAYSKVFDFLKKRYPDQFNKTIGTGLNFVDKRENNSVTNCYFNTERIEYYKYLFNTGFDKEFLKRDLYPIFGSGTNECMMRTVNSFGIGPNGFIYKCLEDFGNEDIAIGNINTGTFNENLLAKYTVGLDTYDDNECLNCPFLPICGGGCPYKKLHAEKQDNTHNCTLYKSCIKDIMKMYYNIFSVRK